LLKSVGWERNRKWAERLAGKLKIPPGVGLLAKAHRKYLQGRGFDPDRIARLWGVQGIGIAARYSWSLFIPIQYRGETVSWTTRSIGDKGKRYSNAPVAEEAIPAKELLYGNDLARQCIIIVEGPADAWAIGPGAVATMGLNYTPAQLNKMIKYPVRVVCFDSETQAQWRANRLADELARYSGETHRVKLETGKDAAEADSDEIAELRKRFLVE
jgi:DNA primase